MSSDAMIENAMVLDNNAYERSMRYDGDEPEYDEDYDWEDEEDAQSCSL